MLLKILQTSQENIYFRAFFNKVVGLNKQPAKDTLTQVFSCEIWYIFKNTFFTEYFRTAASDRKEN